jgi:hypothetical protein
VYAARARSLASGVGSAGGELAGAAAVLLGSAGVGTGLPGVLGVLGAG